MSQMKNKPQKISGYWKEKQKNTKVQGCAVCLTLVVKQDGEEEMTGLGQKLEDVVAIQDTPKQEKSGISEMVLPETIQKTSEEFSENKQCMICFFGNHKNHSDQKSKEDILLCEDCKYKIATFYVLHVQKWQELLSPRSKRKISPFEDNKEQSPPCVSFCGTGRRSRSKKSRKKTGKKSYQQVLWERYQNGDPTVGPLGESLLLCLLWSCQSRGFFAFIARKLHREFVAKILLLNFVAGLFEWLDNDECFCTPHHSTSLDGHFGNQEVAHDRPFKMIDLFGEINPTWHAAWLK
ncbi:hypothetical protein M5K25_011981 [Dendrobium thyrsiflorum]|uniref:Uncharacterized protein n=1 Tax=Dendrobium thyrsiflorum TaxID=117978 RepID=A0ABD0VB86_DENTH